MGFGIFGPIIGALAGPLTTKVVGSIFGLDGKDKDSDGKPRLVAKPEPPKAFKGRDIGDFSPRSFARDRADARGAVGAVAALSSVNPSERETRYWAAIFADAKRKSEIG